MSKKLTIEISESLHKTVKSYASAQGKTMKEFFVEAAYDSLEKGGIGKEIVKDKKVKKMKKISKNKKYITEQEADKLLMPYLLRMIKRIESGKEKLYSWDEVKEELNK